MEPSKNYSELKVDRLVITLGVWNINDGDEQPFGIYFTDLNLNTGQTGQSTIDGIPIKAKPEADVWWRNKIWPNANMAGEHRYMISTQQNDNQ